MTKVTINKDMSTQRWVAEAQLNNTPIATVSGPCETVTREDCLLRLAIILADKLDAVDACMRVKFTIGLPEGR